MSISRRQLKGLGIEDEKAESIIEAHTEVTSRMQKEIDELNEKIKSLQADSDKLSAVQKELNELKSKTADYDDLKQKYEDEKEAFGNFKKKVEDQNAMNKVKDAYKALLKASNIDDKRLDAILKVTDFTEKKLGKDGKFENEENLVEAIKNEWKDFIVSEGKRGAGVETPPANTGGSALTKADIMAIKDTSERQKAIADNPKLFGLE